MPEIVSIVTPSYNMARFLEETIRSVLSQDYPAIEYIVMDGGSTDGSLAILEKYGGRLRYVSEKDKGQADAVNRGFQLSRGSIFAFLNADDTYRPGALRAGVEALAANPAAGVVFGDAVYVNEAGVEIGRYPTKPFDPQGFKRQCYICQPAAFMRREVFESVGMLDPGLRFALDYDLWIKIAKRYPMVKVEQVLATSRMHDKNKTLGDTREFFPEVFRVLQRHYGFIPPNWLYGYCDMLLTGRNPALTIPPPNIANVGFTALLGSYYNYRKLPLFWKDFWTTCMSSRSSRW